MLSFLTLGLLSIFISVFSDVIRIDCFTTWHSNAVICSYPISWHSNAFRTPHYVALECLHPTSSIIVALECLSMHSFSVLSLLHSNSPLDSCLMLNIMSFSILPGLVNEHSVTILSHGCVLPHSSNSIYPSFVVRRTCRCTLRWIPVVR